MRLIYAFAATLLAPFLRLYLRRRAASGKEDPARLPERRGIDATPRPAGRLLWIHAASVGETVSILPVLAALPEAISVLVTTGTLTSAALLAQRMPDIRHRFIPLDVPAWGARFLDHWRPDAAAFVESEIWPNLLASCQARGIRLALINARLSPHSFANWRRLPALARTLFGAFDWVAAQSEADASRLRALGARNVRHDGNLKYAAPPLPVDETELARLRALIGPRPVWLAASTHAGEEIVICQTHRALAGAHPGLLTIIVPRHPERGAEVASLGDAPFPRRARAEDPPPGGIWIGDTLGEMGLYYRLARIVFVGRSLVNLGGQNPLEPARLGCAVAMGPHGFNFLDPIADLRAAGGLQIVSDSAALTEFVDACLRDPDRVAAMGQAGIAASRRAADLPRLLAERLAAL